MTHTKFIDARFFEGDATALEDRLREFLQTFRKRKMARVLLMDRKGGPLLPSIPGNAKVKVLVMVDVADAFARDHVGLMRLSKETRIHYVALRNKLDAAGVRPIDDPARLGTWIYRRAEIPDL